MQHLFPQVHALAARDISGLVLFSQQQQGTLLGMKDFVIGKVLVWLLADISLDQLSLSSQTECAGNQEKNSTPQLWLALIGPLAHISVLRWESWSIPAISLADFASHQSRLAWWRQPVLKLLSLSACTRFCELTLATISRSWGWDRSP